MCVCIILPSFTIIAVNIKVSAVCVPVTDVIHFRLVGLLETGGSRGTEYYLWRHAVGGASRSIWEAQSAISRDI